MGIMVLILVTIGWLIAGKLIGIAVSLSVGTARAKQFGATIGRWCIGVLPVLSVAIVLVGAGGNAGQGFTLFGSRELCDVFLSIPYFAVPILGMYVLAVYVIRDVFRGFQSH